MIAFLVFAAATSTVPAAPQPSAHDLLTGASHAVAVKRLDQAALMILRAVKAGASGPELDRVQADLAYASGENAEALARYEQLLKVSPADTALLESAGIAALKLGKAARASSLLTRATSSPAATWRSWNALGVAADLLQDWPQAERSYLRASELAPGEAEPFNNQGWSFLLRGNWRGAAAFFERAVALDPKSRRAGNNLELARAALAADLPHRLPGEEAAAWAARLNDAGVASAIIGDRTRAATAFTQALGVSPTWYARAANNLEALGRE